MLLPPSTHTNALEATVPCTIRLLTPLAVNGLDRPIPEATCGTLADSGTVTFILDGE